MLPCAAHLHLHLWPCLWLGTHRLAVSHVSLPCPIICAFMLPDTASAPHLLALPPMTCSFLRKSLQWALAVKGAHHLPTMQGDPAPGDACSGSGDQCGVQHAVHLHHRPVLHHDALLHALRRLPLLCGYDLGDIFTQRPGPPMWTFRCTLQQLPKPYFTCGLTPNSACTLAKGASSCAICALRTSHSAIDSNFCGVRPPRGVAPDGKCLRAGHKRSRCAERLFLIHVDAKRQRSESSSISDQTCTAFPLPCSRC